ncbi:phage tail protein [Acinetobacter bohemicus]|uniref:phage tail-collar fiber domain-containing protein n=1 Tax=Acinetobacter TaxID=469 RepID=UPI00209B0F81|nr:MULTISPECIES: phage tail protein [Acinetobacter]MCO8043458.1 phage tail protein [Acinetobacter sp. S4400-12]MCU7225936.1 phage tail protein [Acinetobacter bohemicus]
MAYKTIYTATGLALVSQAVSQQRTIEITHFAVGDGGGNAMIPNESMIQLIREKYRATINRIYQDPENENKYTAEMIIPVTVEGFVVREIALFDRNGNMVLVGNTPEVHKPTLAEGVTQDSVYRIPFVISNPEVLELNFDPNVIIATHQWILNTLTPANMFPGGTNGQVLKKKSNADGDTEWADAGSAEVFVNTIEEEQSLVADQLIVDLSETTTTGAAVYINGDRITNKTGADGWRATSATRITLGKTYPGAKILIVQNEPLGAAPYPLAQKNNLSDVLNKPLARQNLGVMSADEAKFNDCPPGTVIMLAAKNIPTGYRLLKCNGAAYSRTAYADLFAAIGTYYGAGDGVNTFNVPDARGEFPRFADDGRGIDAGRVVGSKQTQQVLKHKHLSFGEATGGWIFGNSSNRGYMGTKGGLDWDNYLYFTNDGTEYLDQNPNPAGTVGNENRPRNIALLACIRY